MVNPYAGIADLTAEALTPAQSAMRRSLIRLMQEKPVRRITVRELCAGAFVARSTFYAYYANVDEMIEEAENDLIFQMICQQRKFPEGGGDGAAERRFFEEILRFVKENRSVFKVLLIDNPSRRFVEKWKNAVKYHLWERLYRGQEDENSALVLETAAASGIALFTYWLEHPDTVSEAGILHLMSSMRQALDQERQA